MANFTKNFNNKQKKGFLPVAILNELNNKWESLFEYQYHKNIGYILTSKEKESRISLIFSIDDIVGIDNIKNKINSQTPTLNDILNYCYNVQKNIEIRINEKTILEVNGDKVNISEVIFPENENIILNEQSIVLVTPPMDYKFEVQIGTKEYSKKFVLFQAPFDSLTSHKYSTNNNSNIDIELIVDENNLFNYKFEINKKNIHSIEEYIECMEFLYKIQSEGMFIDGKDAKTRLTTDDEKKNMIDFYKIIHSVEKEINIAFDLSDINLNFTNNSTILQLNQTLVHHTPIKINSKINNARFIKNKNNDDLYKSQLNKKYKNLYLEQNGPFEINIFNRNISLYFVRGYFNLNVKKITLDNKKNEYVMNFTEDKNNKMFLTLMFFKSEDEFNEFINDENHVKFLYENSKVL